MIVNGCRSVPGSKSPDTLHFPLSTRTESRIHSLLLPLHCSVYWLGVVLYSVWSPLHLGIEPHLCHNKLVQVLYSSQKSHFNQKPIPHPAYVINQAFFIVLKPCQPCVKKLVYRGRQNISTEFVFIWNVQMCLIREKKKTFEPFKSNLSQSCK